MRTFKLALAPALLLALSAAACGDDPPPTVSIEVSPTMLKAGESTNLKVTVTDFTLMAPEAHAALRAANETGHTDGDLSDNEGHYHVYLDSVETNPILMGHLTETPVEIPAGTAEGEHTLIVRLNHTDHTFITPEVRASASITIIP